MSFLHFQKSGLTDGREVVEVSEVLGMLSYALDLTEGQPEGHMIRCAWIGSQIGAALALDAQTCADLLYTLLLKDAGCSSNSARIHELFRTDDIAFKNAFKTLDGTFAQNARLILTRTGRGLSMFQRIGQIRAVIAQRNGIGQSVFGPRCERGADIAARLRFSTAVQAGIRSLDEHWDGSGQPGHLTGADIPRLANIALMAQVIDVFHSAHGQAAAIREVTARSGTWFDPELVAAFSRAARAPDFWAVLAHPEVARRVFALPAAKQAKTLSEDWLDDIAAAFADIIDAKSPYTAEHSRRVTHYAEVISEEMQFDPQHQRWLRRAALLHDLGKLAVSNSILDKPGRLSEEEWRAIHKHPHNSERLLAQVGAFANIAAVTGGHHERLDGKGYPRGLHATDIGIETRILSVADVFDALSAKRPYRDAMSLEKVYEIMENDVGTALDGMCLRALKSGMKRIADRAA